jgi:hypothetical protein
MDPYVIDPEKCKFVDQQTLKLQVGSIAPGWGRASSALVTGSGRQSPLFFFHLHAAVAYAYGPPFLLCSLCSSS